MLAVECGSLRSAASNSGQTQVSLTKSIKRLEVSLGVDLFVRNSRGILLSPEGTRFLPRAQLILSEMRLAQSEASTLSDGQSVVSFGVSPLASIALAPTVVREFRRRKIDVVLRCTSGPYSRLLPALMSGRLEFIACPVLDHEIDESLVVDAMSTHQSVIVARAAHPLRHATSLRNLVECEWIVNGSIDQPGISIIELFRRNGLSAPRIAMHCESFVDAIFHMAQSDLVSLCPPCLDALGITDRMTLIPTIEKLPEQTILLMRRSDRVLSRHAFTLYEIFKKGATKALPAGVSLS